MSSDAWELGNLLGQVALYHDDLCVQDKIGILIQREENYKTLFYDEKFRIIKFGIHRLANIELCATQLTWNYKRPNKANEMKQS